MKKISFKFNFNKKLNCQFFTTIRLSGKLYTVGETVEIFLGEKYIFPAQVMQVKTISLSELSSITASLDTGMLLAESIALIKSFYPDANWSVAKIDIILLKNIEYFPPIEHPVDAPINPFQFTKKASV